MDVDVDEPRSVRRGQRREPAAAAELAVLLLAGRQDRPLAAVGREADDLEPAVGVGHVEQAAVRRAAAGPPPTRSPPPATHRSAPLETSTRWIRAGIVVRRPEGHDRDGAPVGQPHEVLDVDAGRGERRAAPAAAGRGPAGRGAGPARRRARPATSRGAARRTRAPAVGRPARERDAGRMARDDDVAAAVGVDDPQLVVADVGEPTAVGRPLRVRDVLLRRGDLGRRAAAERHDEQLAGAGDLRGVGDDAVARMEAEVARRVDGDDRLDRQPAGPTASRSSERRSSGPARTRRGRRVAGVAAAAGLSGDVAAGGRRRGPVLGCSDSAVAASVSRPVAIRSLSLVAAAGGQRARAAYGPIIARCART